MTAPYEPLDAALHLLADAGPELRNGMTSHAPMVAEALCALGRPGAVLPWVERHRAEILPWPAPTEAITPDRWRDALAQESRFADWRAHFAAELAQGPWRDVLERWIARLAPGVCAAATHGVIRTGHAVRALAVAQTPARVRELGDALASWAATYQELPVAPAPGAAPLGAREAIAAVRLVPPAERRFEGTIVSSLRALGDVPSFAGAIHLLDLRGDPAARVAELCELFARVYLANAQDVLHAIVFAHGVTSIAAVGHLLPHLAPETARRTLRYAWQSAAALYAAFGSRAPAADATAAAHAPEELIERAVLHGDDHAIKLTEACVARHAQDSAPAMLAAAAHALAILPAA